MLQFEEKAEQFINRHSLINNGDFIIVAVSGGPDSLALLHFLLSRKKKYKIKVGAAHVDHMLRGEESMNDRLFVEQFCQQWGIECRSTSINIKEKMDNDQTGLQVTARKYRYQFLSKVMEELQANKLAVAQHGDDQIETILMRLTRGASGLARAGIQVRRSFSNGELIRPLLAVSKSDIEEYCSYYQLKPRYDASNEKRDYTRNRFRLDVLPFLKQENPKVLEHFQRFSEELSEDEQFLQDLAQQQWKEICQVNKNDGITLNITKYSAVAMPLQKRVIQLILNYLYLHHTPDLTALHVDSIHQLITSHHPSGKLDFPNGLKVIRSYDVCYFRFSEENPSPYSFELGLGDEVQLPNGKIIGISKASETSSYNHIDVYPFNPQIVELPLIVRTRRPGDKIQVKGMNGRKKVKDLFIDEKIPLWDRAIWPIVTDHKGTILWVPGLRKSHHQNMSHNQEPIYQIYYSSNINSGGF